MKDFQDFIDSIDREDLETLYLEADTFGYDTKHQAFAIALHLIGLYDNWKKSDSADENV